MGRCFDIGGLAPLFVDAPLCSSVSGKTKVCCCDRGKQGAAAHFRKVRTGALHRTFSEGEGSSPVTNYMEQKTPAVGVSWMENWYNKQFSTNPHKKDKSVSVTVLAVLLRRNAPHYWHGQPGLKKLERLVSIVAGMLGNTEGTFARILRDRGFASTRLVVRLIRAPLDIIRPVHAKRPHWRPLCLSKERVSSNVSLRNLLQFTKDLSRHPAGCAYFA